MLTVRVGIKETDDPMPLCYIALVMIERQCMMIFAVMVTPIFRRTLRNVLRLANAGVKKPIRMEVAV